MEVIRSETFLQQMAQEAAEDGACGAFAADGCSPGCGDS